MHGARWRNGAATLYRAGCALCFIESMNDTTNQSMTTDTKPSPRLVSVRWSWREATCFKSLYMFDTRWPVGAVAKGTRGNLTHVPCFACLNKPPSSYYTLHAPSTSRIPKILRGAAHDGAFLLSPVKTPLRSHGLSRAAMGAHTAPHGLPQRPQSSPWHSPASRRVSWFLPSLKGTP